MRTLGRSFLLASTLSILARAPLSAGFASTETFLPAVGRVPGQLGAQFYTTVWATNLTGATVNFTFDFLKQGQANTSPASFTDTLAPGQTKVYENIVESKLGLTNTLGAARVTSSGEILVAERIYNQAPGDDLGKTEGLFFAGVPKGFSISLGQSASIQGINQGGSENFRYNFALVETGGGSSTVHVVLADAAGSTLGAKDYLLQPYEQLQPNVNELFAGIATTNARITATVTSGTGSVLLAGAQLANESQDSSGFEMSFRDELLGGGSGGLSAVAHDGTLVGNGTVSTPLGINPAAVVTSLNGLHGAVTLAAGSNVTLTPSGQTLTIAAGGAGGGLTLPYTASLSSTQTLFALFNPGTGGGLEGSVAGIGAIGVYGNSDKGVGVYGTSGNGYGVTGSSGTGGGVQGTSGVTNFPGVDGINNGNGIGVSGSSNTGFGVAGTTHGSGQAAAAVSGASDTAVGVIGFSGATFGIWGQSSATSLNGAAIRAQSLATGGIALFATNNGGDATIVATNASNGVIYKGFSNGGTEVFEVNAAGVTATGITAGQLTLPTISNAVVTTTSVCVNGSNTLVLCNASSRSVKNEIADMGDRTDRLLDLRPVTFRYSADPPDAPSHYGLIAEEVASLYPDLVLHDRDGRISGVRYEELSSMLLNALQREHARSDLQQTRIDALAREIATLQRKIEGQRRETPAGGKEN